MTMLFIIISILFSIISINCSKLPESCGTNGHLLNEFSWRIVGGQPTGPGEWPWQVAIKRRSNLNGQGVTAWCGGTIINENWILTAAHCVNSDPKTQSYNIYLGFNDLNKRVGQELIHSVVKIVKHEKWNFDLKEYDIALIKMDESIDFVNKHKFLHPICLPNTTNESRDKCYATGYGYQSENDSTSKKLMKVSEPVYDLSNCSLKMGSSIDKERNICAGGGNRGGLGTCKGDSGGPLQCQSSDGKWYQIGVVSWGQPCAHASVPDVFTRVAFFRNWIEDIIQKD